MSIDYSQIELRVAAHLSGDAGMLECYAEGRDLHSETASAMFGTRAIDDPGTCRAAAKTINFGVLYGMGPKGLQAALRESGLEMAELDCDAFIRRWFAVRPGVYQWIERIQAQVRKDGQVRDLFGRRRLLPGIWSRHYGTVQESLRQAINTPVQSTAAGIIKLGMAEVWEVLKHTDVVQPLLQIHDELLFEVLDGAEHDMADALSHAMTRNNPLTVPLVVNVVVGDNWQHMEAIDDGQDS